MQFKLTHEDLSSKGRVGEITTEHGKINTPAFMPVGTAGTVKAVSQKELQEDVKAEIILGNTYHLYLRPGLEILEKAGGIHGFNSWNRPVLTDSGGYQVYSLAHRRKITEEGVSFASHIDGSKHFFTPESVMNIQRSIGADIVMAFDECPPYPCSYKYAKESMELTHRWLDRSCKEFDRQAPLYGYEQALFPILQGSTFKDLREASAEKIAALDRAGNAIGGLSVGEPKDEMYAMSELVCNILPKDKPRYLMGVGTPANLLENVALGIDMFDCVMPSRNARNGMLFTNEGIINMRNEKWKNDHSPIEKDGASHVDEFYSKAYLRHLLISKEILGAQIASLHNLAFYVRLMQRAREKIMNNTFASWKNKMVPLLEQRL